MKASAVPLNSTGIIDVQQANLKGEYLLRYR